MRDLSASCRMTLLTDLERQGEQEAAISHELPRKPNLSTSFLGGLRGLAALFVLIQHYIGYFGQSIHEHGFGERGNYHLASFPFVRILFSGGNAAVAVFFVLSGYVLSKSPLALIRNGKRSACAASLLSAIIRRPIRLYGPPIGTAFVYAMLLHAPWHIVPQVSWCQPKESILAEAVNWLAESIKFFNPFQTHGSSNHVWYSYDIVAWTIPVELKGSILIYGLTAGYAVSNLPLAISLPALATLYFVLLQLGEWTMACFMAGLILAIIDVHSQSERSITGHFTLRLRPIMWTLIFLTGYYLLCQPAHVGEPEYSLNTPGWHFLTRLIPESYDIDQYYRYWHSWGALLVVYSVLRIWWLQIFFDARPLQYLGKVSFMLYLVHIPVLAIFGDRVSRMLGQVPLDAQDSWWNNRLYIPDVGPAGMRSRFLVTLAVLLPICLAVSDIGTRLLDVPSVKAGKIITRRLGLERGTAQRNGS